MSKPNDVRGLPGDIVLIRGVSEIDVYAAGPGSRDEVTKRPKKVGSVNKKAIGMIIALDDTGMTYVLWSNPLIMGWVFDGQLQKIKV